METQPPRRERNNKNYWLVVLVFYNYNEWVVVTDRWDGAKTGIAGDVRLVDLLTSTLCFASFLLFSPYKSIIYITKFRYNFYLLSEIEN